MFGRTLALTGAAVAATAASGSVASADTRSAWYRQLAKPAIQPPAWVFPLVWTTLYADIAVTSAVALEGLERDDPRAATAYRQALALNLALNASWSWVFFKAHRLVPAIVVAGALAGSSVDLVRRTASVRPAAGLALAPYAAWCSFATVLTAAIWRRNR
jgi:benzodiazapine receptor